MNERAVLARGVYWRMALNSEGNPVAYAVDSRGRDLRCETCEHPALARATVMNLLVFLDEQDPQPENDAKEYRRGYRERAHLSLVL